MYAQSPDDIRRTCRANRTLFEDPEYETVDESLYFSRGPPRPFVWKRPKELSADPKFIDGTVSRNDVQQGMLGDCWFLAPIVSLGQYDVLFSKVVTPDQGFDAPSYCGMFEFHFWRFGKWITIVVDDRLPTYNDKLVFVHSHNKNVFWSALLEKAYAKLNGTYEALKGGQSGEAMVDFTGGISLNFDLTPGKLPNDFFETMETAFKTLGFVCCSIAAEPNQTEAKLKNGLVKGKAYTVTDARKFKGTTRKGDMEVELVRVRNPWGNEREWTGAWSDSSNEWGLIADDVKAAAGVIYEHDGEFWMSYDDFTKEFTNCEICTLGPDGLSLIAGDHKWQSVTHNGAWIRGVSAGGCRNFIDTFFKNEQFRVTINKEDNEDKGWLIVALMQKERRKLTNKLGVNATLTIGFAIYKLTEEDAKKISLDKPFFQYHASSARSPTFVNSREVTGQFHLEHGEYVIVPSTFNADEPGEFILRVFTESKNTVIEKDPSEITKPNFRKERREVDPTLDAKFKAQFYKMAGGDDDIDQWELMDLLTVVMNDELKNKTFSLECARVLVSYFDKDNSGKLNYTEFKDCWGHVIKTRRTFHKFDTDKDDAIGSFELQRALKDLGFSLSNLVLKEILTKYNSKKGNITVDQFIAVCTRLLHAQELFNARSSTQTNIRGRKVSVLTCGLDDFIQMLI